jgi:hypothetical protein
LKLPILALLLVGVVEPTRAQTPAPSPAAMALARRIAGCYQLDDGPWRADSVRVGDVSTKHTPLFFELSDELLRGWDPLQSSEHPMFAVRPAGRSWTYWQRFATIPDTIRISHPLPLAGVGLTLTPVGRDLEGTVEAFTDAVVQGQPSEITRPVYARRIACVNQPMDDASVTAAGASPESARHARPTRLPRPFRHRWRDDAPGRT